MGPFLVFEGIDGAGKSSQLALLAARVEAAGRRVRRLVEPTDGPLGQEIRRRARGEGAPLSAREELDLFVADRRQNVEQNVLPALEAGEVVLQDRYFYSTAAYQAARPELGLSPEEVVALHAWAPLPDRVLLLDLPVSEGLSRVARRGAGDSFETETRQRRVREHFLALAAEDARFVTIAADRPPAEVAAEVWAAVSPLLAPEAAP
ncbi:MAG: dTMP kinase [Planctomycetota bacterium]